MGNRDLKMPERKRTAEEKGVVKNGRLQNGKTGRDLEKDP